MKLSLEQMVGQRILLAFRGKEHVPQDFKEAIKRYRPAGITFFRSLNIDTPQQVQKLTTELQAAAHKAGLPDLLIAVDQEGGQLMTIGNGTTPLPGNMALGAAGDRGLARRAGEVLGRELAAMGINVNYAPSCDVNINPANPGVGIRSFGEDPKDVAELAVAMVAGIQSMGVASTIKHFPGHGDTSSDSHYGLPSVPHAVDRLRRVEFPPFTAAIQAGAKMVMTAHLALPAIDGPDAPPATLSPSVLKGLLRSELGFEGVIVTDAMDMHAIGQGQALGNNAFRAASAGADLLLLTSDPDDQSLVYRCLLEAARNGELRLEEMKLSIERIFSLKQWLADHSQKLELDIVGCDEHRKVADEIAQGSITLVRDQAGILPLHLPPEKKVAVVFTTPMDLTPADTSSYVIPTLGSALRLHHPHVDEFLISQTPSSMDICNLIGQLWKYDLIVIGTINAYNQSQQAILVREVIKTAIPTIVVALRLPYDLIAFPEAQTYICTYSILEPSMMALAKALFGQSGFGGHLPVSIPGLYPKGFRQKTPA
jgi:beta-N-acetylhexosaminidase